MSPAWPASAVQSGEDAVDACEKVIEKTQPFRNHQDTSTWGELFAAITQADAAIQRIEPLLVADFEATHGKGSDTQPFRRFMAEYEVSFPAANLDATREAVKAFDVF